MARGECGGAVLVAQPTCDDLEVNVRLDGIGAEVMAHIVVVKGWQFGLAAGVAHQGL